MAVGQNPFFTLGEHVINDQPSRNVGMGSLLPLFLGALGVTQGPTWL